MYYTCTRRSCTIERKKKISESHKSSNIRTHINSLSLSLFQKNIVFFQSIDFLTCLSYKEWTKVRLRAKFSSEREKEKLRERKNLTWYQITHTVQRERLSKVNECKASKSFIENERLKWENEHRPRRSRDQTKTKMRNERQWTKCNIKRASLSFTLSYGFKRKAFHSHSDLDRFLIWYKRIFGSTRVSIFSSYVYICECVIRWQALKMKTKAQRFDIKRRDEIFLGENQVHKVIPRVIPRILRIRETV